MNNPLLQRIRFFAITWLSFILILTLNRERNILEPLLFQINNNDNNNKRSLEIHKLSESYTNPKILSDGCSVTILLSDPRLLKNEKIWYTLESMAVNIKPFETSCVVLMTSYDCDNNSFDSIEKKKEHVVNTILEKSQHKFMNMIHNGNVRISFLNTQSYPDTLRNNNICNWNINRMYMHPNFWIHEFHSQDSDSILVIQSDVVICHTLDVMKWKDLAFVGSVWSRECGLCNAIRGYWTSWNQGHEDVGDICRDGRAPSGNGGFSFRSRYWMNQVIETCPSKYITIPKQSCYVTQDIAEDIYFATALLGLKAPLPTSIESALFAVETQFLDEVISSYHNNYHDHASLMSSVQRRWGEEGIQMFHRMKQDLGFVVPIGMHKPWRYHSFEVLMHEKFKGFCPFFERVSHEDWLHQGRVYLNGKKVGRNRFRHYG